MKLQKSSIGIGIITAVASSLCCITPLIAILAGSSSVATNFQWIEPLRPWLIGATVGALGLAWYLRLQPAAKDDCGCDIEKPKFWNTKAFLGAVTALSVVMLTFPLYASTLYPKHNSELAASPVDLYTVEFEVVGMTCTGCEIHVQHAVEEIAGIGNVRASYHDSTTLVQYDPQLTTINEITKAIESTSYKVVGIRTKSNSESSDYTAE